MKSTAFYIASTTSTNLLLKQKMRQEDLPEGYIVYTDFQTAGKGQVGNSWESEPNKNLLFSLLLYPRSIKADKQFILSQITGLGVKKVLDKFTRDISIKWPNDIYWKEKKIGGILIENSLIRDCINTCVIGIGLNVNQEEFFSDAPNPVSLKQITNIDTNREELMMLIRAEIMDLYTHSAPEFIHREYLHSLFRKNGYHRYLETETKTIFLAETENILPDGKLILRTESDDLKEYYFKEIQFIL
ncbi:MAG TPA: biotin--[acetyl-CoA-carboxylase] ligase [Paludibacteraceae bacterium]|nr:biotin--[acetyl-CoA-carboxylase] ligase [Paludibacteraceae bacterium]HPT44113.1 biotin--[acetyl-CoA-carboxylase] ligase [Paludibacteraceae bacterium]